MHTPHVKLESLANAGLMANKIIGIWEINARTQAHWPPSLRLMEAISRWQDQRLTVIEYTERNDGCHLRQQTAAKCLCYMMPNVGSREIK